MKRLVYWGFLAVVITVLSGSCFDPPQYSPIPAIEFQDVVFKDVADPSSVDSLIITLKFKDGDGDLGLGTNELGCYTSGTKTVCYNDKFYYTLSDGSYITYKTKRTNPNFDTLPAFIKPYNCINWDIETVNSKIDTFYFQLNPNHYNIFVDFFQSDGTTFTEFDWQKEFGYPNCGIPFDGRFPILSKDLGQKSPLDGTIRYAMQSVGFNLIFSIKVLKLRITIQDRALNKSNTVETPPFTLQQIKK